MSESLKSNLLRLAAPTGIGLTFTLGWFYRPMFKGHQPGGEIVWLYIMAATLVGLVGISLLGAGKGTSRAVVFAFLLLHTTVNAGAFALSRWATVDRGHWEHGMEEFEVMLQSLGLGIGSLVASVLLLLMLVRSIPDPPR